MTKQNCCLDKKKNQDKQNLEESAEGQRTHHGKDYSQYQPTFCADGSRELTGKTKAVRILRPDKEHVGGVLPQSTQDVGLLRDFTGRYNPSLVLQ